MAIIGIDLGTTYSVVATPQVRDGEQFITTHSATLIKDRTKLLTTPSVVGLNPKKEIIVGHAAKNLARMGLGVEPIMFVKRQMNEDVIFELGELRLDPADVSAEILRYLKELAEEQLGETVDEAIITVPAYFKALQRQRTKAAGEQAGLIVNELLLEPVAAALAYSYDVPGDQTIMTYDLGGGTFDVAILEKRSGVFDVKAFDGDRFLGGYNFDLRLAHWIADWINAQGFEGIHVDLEAPEYRVLRTKLLLLAEGAKRRLGELDSYTIIEENTGLIDDNGMPVIIDVSITRQQFEALIDDKLTQTLGHCLRSLLKVDPNVIPGGIGDAETVDEVDVDDIIAQVRQNKLTLDTSSVIEEIIMVGGSSRIPRIKALLEEVFGVPVRLDSYLVDIVVAIGAAIKAKQAGRRIGPLKLEHLPENTSAKTIQVTGRLDTEQLSDLIGWQAVITLADGSSPSHQPIQPNGGFLFERVVLQADTNNQFIIYIQDADGQEVVAHSFAVRQQADAEDRSNVTLAGFVGNVLPKPIKIKTLSGLQTVAEGGEKLPCKRRMKAYTTDQSGKVVIPIYEDNIHIGEIIVPSIPEHLPVHSQVDIELNLRADFFIEGRAIIQQVEVKEEVVIRIPPAVVANVSALQARLKSLQQEAEEALQHAPPGKAMRSARQIHKALDSADQELHQERSPDAAKAQELLDEIETLIDTLVSEPVLMPPKADFDRLVNEVQTQMLPQLKQIDANADVEGYTARLAYIAQQGADAWKNADQAGWNGANRSLGNLYDRVLMIIKDAEKESRPPVEEPPPSPSMIKIQLGFQITEMQGKIQKAALERKIRPQEQQDLERELATCDQALQDIDAEAPDALMRIMQYYQGQHKPIESKVMAATRGGIDPLSEGLVDRLEFD